MGHARFVAPGIVDAFVIATGSQPVVPPFLEALRDKVLTTDTLFEPDALPRTIGVLGPVANGPEISLALSGWACAWWPAISEAPPEAPLILKLP